jgi:hypothetical protein
MAVRLVPQRPAVVETSTLRVPSVLKASPRRLVRPPLDRMPRRQTPSCRQAAATGIPVRASRPRIALPLTHQNDSGSTTQGALPPTSPTRPRPSFRPANARVSRHRLSALPPMKRLPAGIHGPTQEPLDLRARRLFTGCRRPPTACRLLQLDVTRARHRTIRSPREHGKPRTHRVAPP